MILSIHLAAYSRTWPLLAAWPPSFKWLAPLPIPKPDATAPSDEVGARGADTATGIGERTGQRWISESRVIGKPRSVVGVRYNRPE